MRPIDADKARSIFDIQTPKGASASIELILEWIDNQPTITLPGQWIDVNDRLPLPEETVLVATQCKSKGHNILQTCLGFYEDGNVLECDSLYERRQQMIKDDLISRKATIQELGQKPTGWCEGEYEQGMISQWETDVEVVESMPSVTVFGKWIGLDNGVSSCKCSNCGYVYNLYEDDIFGFPYCANCGAKMLNANE